MLQRRIRRSTPIGHGGCGPRGTECFTGAGLFTNKLWIEEPHERGYVIDTIIDTNLTKGLRSADRKGAGEEGVFLMFNRLATS